MFFCRAARQIRRGAPLARDPEGNRVERFGQRIGQDANRWRAGGDDLVRDQLLSLAGAWTSAGIRRRPLDMTEQHGPLRGVKVVACSTAQAGTVPYMLMADLGAEVIKIEVPEIGDNSRGSTVL